MKRSLVVQDDVDRRTLNMHPGSVVFNDAQLPKAIEKETDSGAGCADHFGESFLAHFRDEENWFRFLTKVGEQQEKTSQRSFAGIEEMIHQVCFHSNVPGEQVGEKAHGKFRVLMEEVQDFLFSNRMTVQL